MNCERVFSLLLLLHACFKSAQSCSPSCINGGSCNGTACLCQAGYVGAFCQISKPYLSKILQTGSPSLRAFWPLTLEFGATDVYDLSNPIDGTIIGGSIPYAIGPYGVANSAIAPASAPLRYVAFNSSKVSLTELYPSGWTFSMWARLPGTGAYTFLCFQNPANATQECLRYGQDVDGFNMPNHAVWPLYGGFSTFTDDDSCSLTSTWQYVSLTYTGSLEEVNLVCGTSVRDDVPADGGPPKTYSRLTIGYRPKFNTISAVRVACLSIHNKELNATELAATRDLCKYFSYQCSGVTCTGGKVCNGLGICDCPPGYTGTNCSAFDCFPSCGNGGTCVSPFSCSCTAQWTGTACQQAICTSPCLNGGSCSAPDTCSCPASYTGAQCQTCQCLNGGSCSGSSAYCDCPSSHYGQLCEFLKAHIQSLLNAAAPNLVGYWPFTSSMASKDTGTNAIDGTIVSTITYQVGPYGLPGTSFQSSTTQAYVFFNSPLIDFDATSSSWTWGTWIYTQTSGTVYFFEIVAATTTSTPTYIYQSGAYLGFYSDYGEDEIACNMYSGWTYIAVNYDSPTKKVRFYCGSTLSSTIVTTTSIVIMHPRVFLGFSPILDFGYSVRFACMSVHGAALSAAQITAVKNLCKYFSVSCSISCTNGTICVGYEICQCAPGWSGINCTVPNCTQACSYNRYCSAPDVCSCNAGWTGSNCTEPICNPSCQNGGNCTLPDTCTCPSGWTGSSCATFTCSQTCLNGGICSGPNTCSCNSSYTGSVCENPVCSQGCEYGICTSPNVCTCYGGFIGPSCNISFCSPDCINGGSCFGSECHCPVNYTGKYCQIAKPFIQNVLAATSSSLLAYWPLNDDFGVNDAYGYQMNGTVPAALSYATGPYDKSQSAIITTFSPYRYVTFSSSLLDVGANNGSWTLAMWIKTPTTTSAPIWHFYSPTSNSTEGLRLIQDSADSLYVHSNGNFQSWSCTMSGVWQFMGISYHSSNKTLSAFCNNAFLSSSFVHTTNPTTYSRVYLGYRPSSPSSHTFNFACVSLHSASLTSDHLLTVKEACRYFTLSCATACSNGGSCVGSDICDCPAGYQGNLCQEAICSPNCLNGGNCSAPNVCTCPTGFNGSIYENPICVSPCQNGGNCTLPNTCTCAIGWAGPTCGEAVCTTSCINGGTCVLPDTCSCPITWSGSSCQSPVCDPSCLNGNCTSPGNCTCSIGWKGNHCHEAVCGTTGCANLGNCTAPDVCVCQPGWTGLLCETAICSQTCHNNATCAAPNTCTCTAGWTGTDCSSAICSQTCLNGGNCSAPNICTCHAGFNGSSCESPICLPPCQNGGNCTSPNTCTCPDGWIGTSCEQAVCVMTCLNGGSCISPDICNCLSGWTSSRCETPICTSPCLNDGNCTGPDICSCAPGYTGSICENGICSPDCQHGNCTSPDVCSCESGWDSSDCSSAICNQTCLNGATCSNPNTCTCMPGYSGSSCETPVCNPSCSTNGFCSSPDVCTCQAGWTGSTCSSAICNLGCQNGGFCSAPETCTCTTGWTGGQCDAPICTDPCNSLGGHCSAPYTCTCNSGWVDSLCETPVCSEPCQNDGNCTLPDLCTCSSLWEGDHCEFEKCPQPCQHGNCSNWLCICEDHWTGSQCETAICDNPCQNNGNCIAPNVCSCILGFEGAHCEIYDSHVTIEDITNLSDEQLLHSIGPVKNTFLNMAASISETKSTEKVTEMLESLSSVLDRYGNITEMPAEVFAEIALAASSAADAMLTSVTSEETSSGEDDELEYEERTMKCKVEADGKVSAVEPDKPPPAANAKEKMRKMFNSFMTMLVNMFANLRAILKPGMNMTFSGEFYGAVVFNVKLRDVPGLVLDSNLATATFPKIDDPYQLFGPMPAKCSPLFPDSTIPVVISAFVINVMDVDKPFNMPTVAVRMYCPEQAELLLNKALPTRIVAKPSQKKAALFNNQKKDAQCDVSKVKCDLTENAGEMGSMATFPVTLNAGDFVLIFPNIEHNYSAYISFNSTPSARKYHLQANVSSSEVSLIQNGTFDEPRWHHRPQKNGDLRIIIPEKAINQFIETLPKQDNPKFSIYVYTKRNFSAFDSLDELPPSACELQRTFGYHLRIGLAQDENTIKVRRSIDTSTLDGFQLEPESTESAVVFTSSYFGDFGADLAVSPNTIEFTDIFANFASLVANNAGVLVFQCCAIAFFFIAIGFCWKFDREDLKQWAFLPILSNKKHQHVRYLVSIHITRVKNVKYHSSRLSLRLLGSIYDTTWRVMEDGVRKNVLDGKLPANFTLTTQIPMGRIDAIDLWLERVKEKNRPNNPRHDAQMHIDRVVILDVNQGLKHVFLVRSTLKNGEKKTTALATEDEMKGYTYLISGHSRTSITDIHPWLSTMKRPLPSNWTRVERLACVVSALFMAMLVNAMFYGKDATAPKVGLKIGSWLTISWFTFWTSFIGCIVVIPPTAVIAFIFKKIKRKSAETSAYATVFNINVRTPVDEAKPKKNMTRWNSLTLPYWTIIIAWFLVAACIGISAFFVVMYSLSWGQEKSLAWLSGMILNVVQDIILIQPVKVILSSVFSATIHSLPDDGINMGRLVYNPRNNRKNVELFNRLRGVLTGIIHHTIYVIFFAATIATTTNRYSYQQINSLKPYLSVDNVGDFDGTIVDYSQIFEWLNSRTLPLVLTGNQLDKGGIFSTANDLYKVPNPNVVLLGPIRLTQQRVATSSCPLNVSVVPAYVQRYQVPLFRRFDGYDLLIICQRPFSNNFGYADAHERRVFNGSWNILAAPQNYWHSINLTHLEQPWIYRSTDGIPYAGWEATYKTGGYYVELPKKLKNARTVIAYLHHSKWLDNATNSLFVEFNLLNVQTNLFVPVKIVFEALTTGGMSYHIRMFPLQLYMYSGASSMLNFAVQGIWTITLFSFLIKAFMSMKKEGRKSFFKNGWNVLELLENL